MTRTTSSRIKELEREWKPKAEWTVETPREETTFYFPAFGPGTYDNVVGQVMANRKSGANLPRNEQTAFLLDEAYNSGVENIRESPRSEFVREDIMRNGWLWLTDVKVWTPEDDKDPTMYSVSDEDGKGLVRKYTIAELEDRLSGGDTERGVRISQDRTVAAAPRSTIQSGYHEKGRLAYDGSFIATFKGVEGAEAIDRVSKQFALKPYSWIVSNNSDELIHNLSALYWGRVLVDDRLGAGFYSGGCSGGGYVLSVSGSESVAEGDAPKK